MTENYRSLLEIFIECETQGIKLTIEDGKLAAYPSDRVTADLAERIRLDRDRVKAVLKRESPDCRLCSAATVAIPTFDKFENFECCRCGECSGCRKR